MERAPSADGTTITFDRTGDGPALVVVGGALADRSAARPVADLLAARLRVHVYDRRGRGESGDTAPYAVDREVEDLAAVIAAAGGSASVYGHSSGAVLALEAAARGLPITRLAVYEPPYVVSEEKRMPAGLAGRVADLVTAGRRGEAVRLFLTEAVEAPADVIAAMESAPTWPAMEALAHTVPYDLAVTGDRLLPAERLAALATPTLVLDGGSSPSWIRTTAETLARTLPRARHATLTSQSHRASPEALAPVLLEFFTAP
jgi:pimeloyl-ACP methyl ester carboxylesterase